MSKAAVVLVVLGVFAAALAPACSSDAVGVDACRKIEAVRCEAATACGATAAESDYCLWFYQDQCLHGMANPGVSPSDTVVDACIDALRVVETCARNGAQLMSQCTGATLIGSANPGVTLICAIINRTPEQLTACSFLTPGVDAGSSGETMPDASTNDDGGGGSGGGTN